MFSSQFAYITGPHGQPTNLQPRTMRVMHARWSSSIIGDVHRGNASRVTRTLCSLYSFDFTSLDASQFSPRSKSASARRSKATKKTMDKEFAARDSIMVFEQRATAYGYRSHPVSAFRVPSGPSVPRSSPRMRRPHTQRVFTPRADC